MRGIVAILLSIAITLPVCFAAKPRTAGAVKKEKQETAKMIDRTRRQINDNMAQTREELSKLNSIKGEMKKYRVRTSQLRGEAGVLGARRKALSDSIDRNSRHIEALKVSLAKSLVALRTQRRTSDLAFIFSSESFAQAGSRTRYLRELSKWQHEKIDAIREASDRLTAQKERLDTVQRQILENIDSLRAIESKLSERKNKANALVGSLKRQGKNLNKLLAEQERKAKNLDRELNRIIEEEARKAKAESEKPGAPKGGKKNTEADMKLSGSFANNKGRLPWPVDRDALIVSDFGRHTHSDYSKVEIQNNGIDFESSANAQATAVFDGTVSMIIVMDGYENVVLVRHGDYLTVYAGIKSLNVHKGQKINAGQVIGSIAQDAATGKAKLHFEVRHEKEKLDPSQWLRE